MIRVIYVFDSFHGFVIGNQSVINVFALRDDSVNHAESHPASAAAGTVGILRRIEIHLLVDFDFIAVNVHKSPGNVHAEQRNSGVGSLSDDFGDKAVLWAAQLIFAEFAVGQKLGRKVSAAVRRRQYHRKLNVFGVKLLKDIQLFVVYAKIDFFSATFRFLF